MPLTFIDLFAGIGGMRLALEAAGCKCVFSCEINRSARKTYYTNFGQVPRTDIRNVKASDVPDHDILAAGFPCQPFSISGVSKNNSLGRPHGFRDETQGTLFFEICRIIEAKRPKAFILENVKNLLSHDAGRTFRIIQRSLQNLGYETFHHVLDGRYFTPQHRERLIIVGFDRERYGFPLFRFDIPRPKQAPVLRDVLEQDPDEKYTLHDGTYAFHLRHAERHRQAGHGFGFSIASLDGAARTLSHRYWKDGSEILIGQEGKNPRKLTPRECARLQGFPDSFIIPVSDTEAYKQFGNSVVVPMIAAIARLVVSELERLQTPRI